ncbi:MAG TPA: hypothetical protein VFN02_07675 [Ktedonobacteraceae bacterium]|nr:hypothetical protein [Ktedonobacteraceae bacterium]
MSDEIIMKTAIFEHAHLLLKQHRIAEARQPENWKVLLDTMMQWSPFAGWVVCGDLTRDQIETWLNEAITFLQRSEIERIIPGNLEALSSPTLETLAETIRRHYLGTNIDQSVVTSVLLEIKSVLDQRVDEGRGKKYG